MLAGRQADDGRLDVSLRPCLVRLVCWKNAQQRFGGASQHKRITGADEQDAPRPASIRASWMKSFTRERMCDRSGVELSTTSGPASGGLGWWCENGAGGGGTPVVGTGGG